MHKLNTITLLEKICLGLDYQIYKDESLMANAKIGALHYGIELDQCTPTFILNADNNFWRKGIF